MEAKSVTPTRAARDSLGGVFQKRRSTVRRMQLIALAIVLPVGVACGGSQHAGSPNGAGAAAGTPQSQQGGARGAAEADGSHAFHVNDSDTAGQAHGAHPSQIQATRTKAAMRLFVVDPATGPIQGIVIKLTAPDGAAYYTAETDSQGYAEVLVPVGQRYQMEYLSLGRRNTTASVQVPSRPNFDLRLTLRYRRLHGRPRTAPHAAPAAPAPPRFELEGVYFDSGRATIRSESNPRLDRVVEYMTHKPNARIRVAGYTDNVGNPQANQRLSEQRAQAVRDYLVSHGIDQGRIEAVGYGDQDPVASNDTDEGRQKNRRIEAVELTGTSGGQ